MSPPVLAAGALVAAAAVFVLPAGDRRARLARVMGRGETASSTRVRALLAGPVGSAGVATAVAVASGLLGGPVAAFAAGTYAWLGVRAVRRRSAARADAQLRAVALEALSGLADDARAGRPPADALVIAVRAIASAADAETAAALRAVEGAAADAGVVAALRGVTHPALRDVTATLAAVWSLVATGIPLAGLTERMEAELRARQAAARRAEAQLAGARATSALLAGLPGFGLLIGVLLGAQPLAVLLTTALGGSCAVAAIALQVAGGAWSRRIMSAAGVS